MNSHWRDNQAWRSLGLHMSTPSDEACKMFDASVCQYVGWYNNDSVGGIEGSVERMLVADQDFVMGNVLKNGLELLSTGHSTRLDETFRAEIEQMKALADRSTVTPWEKKHLDAIYLWSKGNTAEACTVWEDILSEKPKDILALKFAHDTYFYLGYLPQMRDSVARVLPYWNSSIPLYGYLHGMLAFGQEETNLYDQAEKSALKSCEMLACHNYWHWALYHIELGNYEDALNIYDSQLLRRSSNSGAMLDIVDAASLLYRLQLEGIDCTDRWADSFKIFRPHINDHVLSFNDVHIMMSCLGADQSQDADKLLNSLRDFIKNGEGTNREVSQNVGLKLCEALMAYQNGDYAAVVNLMMPIRYQIVTIGGSNAQRDLFNLLLICAAIKSPVKHHHQLARNLAYERKSLKKEAPMTDRLMAKALAIHTEP